MPEQTSPLRQRMIDDMTIRNMAALTQAAYVRAVKNFSKDVTRVRCRRLPLSCQKQPSCMGTTLPGEALRCI